MRTGRRNRSHWRDVAALGTVLLVAATSTSARAQPAASAIAAEDLFRQGRELLEQRHFSEACAKLEASQKLEAAVGTLFSLGECYEGAGKAASAWFAFRGAVALAAQRQDPRRTGAQQRADALAPRLAHLAVRLRDRAGELQVRIDGEPIGADAVGTPFPVDAGSHRVEARGDEAFAVVVQVTGDGITVDVDVPSLVHTQAPAVRAVGAWKRPVGLALLGGGAAALVTGAGFGMQAIVKGRDVHATCPLGPTCADASAVHENGVAQTYADVSTVLLPLGAVLAGAGAVLAFSGVSFEPVATPVSGRLDARWTW